jgi:subtilisin family serine protease
VNLRFPKRTIAKFWRNSQKEGLIDQSIDTIQARPAHVGFKAEGKGVTWAVLDTGIRDEHPHFREPQTIESKFDCTQPGVPPAAGMAQDLNGHGTHVAGIIAGEWSPTAPLDPDKGTLFRGMAPYARLSIYKVLSNVGTGRDSWIIKALDHIAERNEKAGSLVIHGINLSLGGPFDPMVFGPGHSPLCEELRRLWRQGVVICIAAGNEGAPILQTSRGLTQAQLSISIVDPANLDEAIAVGGTHRTAPHNYGVSYFSSRGPTADGRCKPDLVAPAEKIRSASHLFPPDDKTKVVAAYIPRSGTSMAAPHISGIIAAFLSLRREFIGYPDKVKQILLENCVELNRDVYSQGRGLASLARMLSNT